MLPITMPDTPLYLQAHFREQVKDAFEVAIQQDVSKFSDAGIVDSEWTADQVVVRTGAPVNFIETTGQRGGVTQTGEYQAGFRSGFVRDFECGITFDRNDSRKLATANLPTSEVQAAMRRAWMRKRDDVFIDASMAQALGGPKPCITPQANPAFMTIPVDWAKTAVNTGINSRMTIWKIEEWLRCAAHGCSARHADRCGFPRISRSHRDPAGRTRASGNDRVPGPEGGRAGSRVGPLGACHGREACYGLAPVIPSNS